jgi:pimeloyl-ACP methyl ester carboxylesterase
MIEQLRVDVDEGQLEVFVGGVDDRDAPLVAAAHPASAFEAGTIDLLATTAGIRVVVVNARGLGGSSPLPDDAPQSLADMVDEIETVRRRLGLGKWTFWGMSGGGWLAQIYAHRHPSALAGIIVESACACFRERLADPACVLSPFFPAWHDSLDDAGLFDPSSHDAPSEAVDAEWIELEGVGSVFRRRGGPALVVAPFPVDPAMRRAMPVMWTFDARVWLPTVRVPTLVLCGDEDAVVPVAHARAVHDAIAGASLTLIEGAGHVPTVERRPEVARAVRAFLDGR